MADPAAGIDLRDPTLPAEAVARALQLASHPEGGWYRETWRDSPADGGRGAGTSILFLLSPGESSHWHRVDASEGWHWQAGAPMQLHLCEARDPGTVLLGPDLGAGQQLSAVVPPGWWQAAAPLPRSGTAGWSLVCCTVSPAFQFEGFELAPPGWQPDGRG